MLPLWQRHRRPRTRQAGAVPSRVIRDRDGVAHIRADDEEGALRGQGFAAAQDRLWQMEFDRRKALGRLAEVIGAPALPSDRFHLRLGVARAALSDLAVLAPRTVAILEAYAEGVNAALGAVDDLPPEFGLLGAPEPDPWEPWHSIAVFKVRHLAMGTAEVKLWRSALLAVTGPDRLARLWPDVEWERIDPAAVGARDEHRELLAEAHDLVALLASVGEDDPASNNFVLSGDRTATGAPIMAGDPHRAIDLPNVYWQNHLTWDGTPGGDVIGLSFPGVPGFPHFGHNRDVAWSITHGMADDQDLYLERLRSEDNGTVEALRGNSWVPVQRREEVIPVAGGPEQRISCLETENGPVVAGGHGSGLALSLRWTATAAPDTTFDCLLPQMAAADVQALDRAFENWVVPCNNVLAADRSGAILYRFRGRLAVRPRSNGWTVVDGADVATAWEGFVPDSRLWRIPDPARGFLVTANNPIGDGPYVSNDWAHPARSRRLTELLGEDRRWSVMDAAETLSDTHSTVAATLARRLCALDSHEPLEAASVEVLDRWDGHMRTDSAGAAIYGATRAEVSPLLSDALRTADAPITAGVGYTQAQRSRAMHLRVGFVVEDTELLSDDLLAEAFRRAVRRLESELGPDPLTWRWGSVHTAAFHHPLGVLRPDLADSLEIPPPVPLGGDNECVWASGTIPPSMQSFTSPVARYVFDLGDWDNSGWIVPHGVSGDPRSAHFSDQLDHWATGTLLPMRFTAEAVDAASIDEVELADDGTA